MELSGLVVSFLAGLLLLPAGTRGLRDAGLVRRNYRDRETAFPLGALIATTGLIALAPLAFLDDRADLDLVAGRVAMVFSLLGARGSFGVNETADRLLPDLLAPVIPRRPGPGSPPPPRPDQVPPGTPNVGQQQPAGR